MSENKKYTYKITGLIVFTVAIFFMSFFVGRYSVDPVTAVKIIIGKIIPFKQTWTSAQYNVVMKIRFPRIACAALIGAALSVSGASYQGMFRNPMVSPDLLGASTGAGFGAALSILFGFSYLGITLVAFAFGIIAVFLAYAISRKSKMQTSVALILAGVMIGSLFSSGTSFIKLVADTESELPAITYWLMGSLASVKINDLYFSLIPILLGLFPLVLLRWRINLLTVSEAEALSMGVETKKLRLFVILCATLMTSASVAISGMIGWVGLVIPHFCRMIYGEDYRKIVPACAFAGASFMMIIDDLSRVVSTAEIPLGILTSFVGAPVFIYLIAKGGYDREN